MAARRPLARRRRMFCPIVASAECVCSPLGATLDIFTLLVLARDDVRTLFEA